MKPSIRSLALALFTFLQASVALSDAPLIWGPNNSAKLLNSGDLVAKNGYIYPNIPSAFTVGSVPFASASSTLSQDNAKFFWDDTNFRLGIGTSSPTRTLDVYNPSSLSVGFKAGDDTQYIEQRFDFSTPTARFIVSGPSYGGPGIYGVNDFSWEGQGSFRWIFDGNTPSNSILTNTGKLGISTTTPSNNITVSGNASIGSGYNAIAAPTNGLIVQGSVGIGTSNPVFSLDVVQSSTSGVRTKNNNPSQLGSVLAQNDLGNYASMAATGGSWPAGLYGPDKAVFYGSGFANGTILLSDSGPLELASATAVNLTMTQAGNIGIGTTSPGSKFDVAGKFQVDSNGNPLKINNVTTSFPASQGGVGTILKNDGAGNLTWGTAGGTSVGGALPTASNIFSNGNTYVNDIVNPPLYVAQRFTATSTGNFVSYETKMQNYNGPTGCVLQAELWSDNGLGGANSDIGSLLASSTTTLSDSTLLTDFHNNLATSSVPSSIYNFAGYPVVSGTMYWVVVRIISGSLGPNQIFALTNTGTTSPPARAPGNAGGYTATTYFNANVITPNQLVLSNANNYLDSSFLNYNVNLGGNVLSGVSTPLAPTDAANKAYVDSGGFTGTTGSVPFVGAGGTLTEDNTKLFWDDTNKRLGIGTSNFNYTDYSQNVYPALFVSKPNNGQFSSAVFKSGDVSNFALISSSASLSQISAWDYYGMRVGVRAKGAGAGNVYLTTGDDTVTAQFNVSGNTGIGTGFNIGTNPASTLSVNGNASIGSSWASTIAAPTNGLIVQGNVGIGTSSPANQLDVSGKFQVDSNGNPLKINNVATSFPAAQGAASTVLTNDGAGNLTWGAAGGSGPWATSGVDIYNSNTGNVGIGTSSPLSKLHVSSSVRSDGDFLSIAGNHQIWNSPSVTKAVSFGMNNPGNPITDDFIFSLFSGGWSERMRLTQAGNLGIGTTTPLSKLSIANGASVGGSVPTGSGFTVSGTGANNRFVTADGNKTLNVQVTGASNYGELSSYDFGTSLPFPFYLNANGGNVGVGSLNASSSLSVTGNASVGSGYNTTAAPTNGLIVQGNVGIGTSSPAKQLDVSGKFQVDSNGNPLKVNNVATSFPAAQGAASTVLTNDGAGNLTWNAPASAVTSLTGEATGTGPGATAVTLTNSAVIGKVLTGFTPTAGQIASTDSILQAVQKNDANWTLNYFGDGSSGAFNATSGTTTLTSDVYYSSLTISGIASIVTSGFRIFVNGTCDFSNAPVNAIAFNGNSGSAGSASIAGGSGGTAVAAGTISGSVAAAAGGAGTTTTGTQGAVGTCTNPSNGGSNGATLIGGTGSSGAGGAARGQLTPSGAMPIRRWMVDELKGVSLITGGCSGGGGNGGGGDGSAGAGGGGGGAGGGNIYLACQTINRGPSTSAFAISANGGQGGNGGTPAAGNRGGGSGGPGGGGGWVYIAYRYLTGSTATSMIRASGGQGGTGGNGFGTGTGGGGGGGGNFGRITVYNVQTATSTEVNTGTGGAGGAAVGITGGTAGTPGNNNVSL